MKKKKLKPCPFCKEQPFLSHDRSLKMDVVICSSCIAMYGSSFEAGSQAWNSRPIDDELNQ